MTMKQYVFLTIMTTLGCSLCACSRISGAPTSFAHRDQTYLSAVNTPPLRIPPGVNGEQFHAYYPIPERPAHKLTAPINLQPT